MTLSISTFQNSDLFPIMHWPPMAICYCRGGEHGQMVGCDNDDCPYQWFHLDCLKLTAFPKSKTWYCPQCQKRRRGKYSRVQRADQIYKCKDIYFELYSLIDLHFLLTIYRKILRVSKNFQSVFTFRSGLVLTQVPKAEYKANLTEFFLSVCSST